MNLDQNYWDTRYQTGNISWDMGVVSPPLQQYFDQVSNKDIRILIPGGGNSYEAEYLVDQGFSSVTVIDISRVLIDKLQSKFNTQKGLQLICGDFFKHTGTYDLIVEQTFFCALPPSLRTQYVDHMSTLLVPGGKLVGLLFDRTFDMPGPPFGGSKEEYEKLFDGQFHLQTLGRCFNSYPARKDTELFMQWIRK